MLLGANIARQMASPRLADSAARTAAARENGNIINLADASMMLHLRMRGSGMPWGVFCLRCWVVGRGVADESVRRFDFGVLRLLVRSFGTRTEPCSAYLPEKPATYCA